MTAHVVISLDFELRWGVADKLPDDADAYRRNLDGETEAVYAMLDLFRKERIGATWGTVGALACSGWEEYHERAPRHPAYQDRRLRFRAAWQGLDPQGKLHFAPDAVRAIADVPHQELASHTFSHIYFQEPGCEAEDVAADARAVASLFGERFGRAPTSLIFPRNQIGHVATVKQAGIERWRTNPIVGAWNSLRRDEQNRWVRGLRLFDDVVAGASRRAPSSEMRASYLVRFPLADAAWKLHLARIRRDARRLRSGQSLHLWWHPHNMGSNVASSMRRLSALIDAVREDVPDDTRFVTMKESSGSVSAAATAVRTKQQAVEA